ncbi:uncharacterized protein LOC131949280 [Physella acuta]|uniref:uncharacterized protein LOC131949280 n=1 Tax=Physella acuta TaxID=109671 RepID=UPI0027DBCD2C|nr:uncharacterized protein LOC131949280 [Physella acuta]
MTICSKVKNVFSKKSPYPPEPSIGTWDVGLFSCFRSVSKTVLALCCPCYLFGKLAEATERDCCCYGFLCLTPASCYVQAIIRQDVRVEQEISGSIWGDFLTVLCCPWCSLVQEAREIQEID